jgi:hypothetical protein
MPLADEFCHPFPLFMEKTDIYDIREKYYLDFYTMYLVKFFGLI